MTEELETACQPSDSVLKLMSMAQCLYITDGRSSKRYEIPVRQNAIQASDLASIQDPSDKTPKALRVVDECLRHIAIGSSQITLLDAERGRLYYRGYDITSILGKKTYEEACYCLVWGDWPPRAGETLFRHDLAASAEQIPQLVFDVIQRFPYVHDW